MIELDSDRWGDLRHAYGSAVDVPPLLRGLASAPVKTFDYKTEPWFSLWSALCHQSDVYPASYAAVPHIISAATGRAPEHRAEYLHLVGTIESMRHKPKSPPIPADLELSYKRALRSAVALALESLQVEADESWFRGLLASLAAFRGFPQLAAAVDDLEKQIECPSCEHAFIARGYDYFA